MNLENDYQHIKLRFLNGGYKGVAYSDNEDDVKELVQKLLQDGYPTRYFENGMCKGQYIIRRTIRF